MTLKEIFTTTPWQDIAIALVSAYPNQRRLLEGYQIVFETLKLMEPKESEMTLYVVYDESKSEDGGHDVYGIKADKPDERWGLLFVPWAEWLGIEPAEETISTCTPEQIAASCLFEMTYFGFTEEQRKQQEASLDESIKEAEEHPEDLIEMKPEEWHIEISTKGYLRCLDRWLRWSTLSREYFGENDSWFKDNFLRKKAPDYFNEIDRQTLKAALKEIAREIEDVAEEM